MVAAALVRETGTRRLVAVAVAVAVAAAAAVVVAVATAESCRIVAVKLIAEWQRQYYVSRMDSWTVG